MCYPCLYRVQPTSLLKPSKQTLQAVAEARAKERLIIREYHLLAESGLHGENTEDRVAAVLSEGNGSLIRRVEACDESKMQIHTQAASSRNSAPHRPAAQGEITAAEIAQVEADESISEVAPLPGRVLEFAYEESSSPEERAESGIRDISPGASE